MSMTCSPVRAVAASYEILQGNPLVVASSVPRLLANLRRRQGSLAMPCMWMRCSSGSVGNAAAFGWQWTKTGMS